MAEMMLNVLMGKPFFGPPRLIRSIILSQQALAPTYPFASAAVGGIYETGETTHMFRAIWNGEVLAESDRTIVVEANHYFPPDSINRKYFQESNSHTTCAWKGLASYYDIQVNGEVNKNAAWYYPAPKEAAQQIKDYVAFWHGVKVQKVNDSR